MLMRPWIIIILVSCCSLRTVQQQLFFFEKCTSMTCPVDCQQSIADSGCPKCRCPLGQRCPVIICPTHTINKCRRTQRMDGCMTCVCNGDTYSIFDKFNNVETYMLNRRIPGSIERCKLDDIRSIDRCTKGLMDFRESLLQQNPSLITAMYPWFKQEKVDLERFCAALRQVPQCVGNRMLRCQEQHPDLSYLMTVYGYPCMENRKEFLATFDCIHNVLVGHGKIDRCDDILLKQISIARKIKLAAKERRRMKCEALNDFVICTKPVLQQHCGIRNQTIFHESILKASAFIAPECKMDTFGVFKPITARYGGVGIRIRENKNTQISSNHRRRDFIQSNRRNDDKIILTVSNRLSKANCHRVGANRFAFSCLDGSRPIKMPRWYRRPGEPECRKYNYGYCGEDQEKVDKPIKYEDLCYDHCFTKFEKYRLRFI